MGVAVKLSLNAALFHSSPNIGTILQVTVCPNPVLACFASILRQFFVGCASRAWVRTLKAFKSAQDLTVFRMLQFSVRLKVGNHGCAYSEWWDAVCSFHICSSMQLWVATRGQSHTYSLGIFWKFIFAIPMVVFISKSSKWEENIVVIHEKFCFTRHPRKTCANPPAVPCVPHPHYLRTLTHPVGKEYANADLWKNNYFGTLNLSWTLMIIAKEAKKIIDSHDACFFPPGWHKYVWVEGIH